MSPVTIIHRSHRRPAWRPCHPYCRCCPSSITDHTRCPARRAGSARYVVHPMRHRADRLRTPGASFASPVGLKPGCAGYRPARLYVERHGAQLPVPGVCGRAFRVDGCIELAQIRRPGWSATSWAIPAFSEQVQLPCPLSTTAACRCRHHHWSPELRAIKPPETPAQ
jgi:hypothetical protein